MNTATMNTQPSAQNGAYALADRLPVLRDMKLAS